MKLFLTTICLAFAGVHCIPKPEAITQLPAYTQLNSEQIRHLQNRGFGSTVRSFRPTVAYREAEEEIEDEDIDSEPESSQDRVPTYVNQNYPIQIKSTLQPNQNYPIPVRSTVAKAYPVQTTKPDRRPIQQNQQYVRSGANIQEANNNLEEEEKEEEPDRLTLLLPQSRFNCNGRHTGYYADEDLHCEVFHYCQENAKHSWICPEGFTFHQVHLICMPPGGDNICEKSSDFHFVNDFLYKPLNLEEYQHKPNVTLRYSDRYYPESYRPRYDDEENEAPNQHQHSIRVPLRVAVNQPRPQHVSPSTLRPQPTLGQVFRSPEEINISLQQRRPIQYTTAKYEDY